ncbi:MAG: NAD-dependent epimerase/dehydratase family protein [Balneolales bacterium]
MGCLRALLLGGTGFVGSAMLHNLLNEGAVVDALYHRQVPGHLKEGEPDHTGMPDSGKSASSIQKQLYWHAGSISRFPWDRFRSHPPEIIFHAARIPGRTPLSRVWAGYRGRSANRRLIRWAAGLPSPPAIVYFSGTLVYGDQNERLVREDTPVEPTSFQREYFLAETPVLEAQKRDMLPVLIVRPPWIYGPGSWFRQFYHRHVMRYGEIPAFGDGSQIMSLIHVNDLAGYITHVCRMMGQGKLFPREGGVIHAYSHSGIRHRDWVQLLSHIYGKPVRWYPESWLGKTYGRSVREALTFSMDLGTHHTELFESYEFLYPDLEQGVRTVAEQLMHS